MCRMQRALLRAELATDDAFANEFDERVRLGIHVFAGQQYFRKLENLLQPPDQRLHVVGQRFVCAQRVQVVAVRLEGRVVVHVGERLGRHTQPLVDLEIFSFNSAG